MLTFLAVDYVSDESFASLKEDDDVTEALCCVTRARWSNSLTNNSGTFQRIRQKHWMVIRGLAGTHRGQDQVRVLHRRAVQGHSGGAQKDAT